LQAIDGVSSLQGYGTIKFHSAEQAQKAIEDFNGWELESRSLTVKMDQYA
jgi:RNA recognition motif-containing protein